MSSFRIAAGLRARVCSLAVMCLVVHGAVPAHADDAAAPRATEAPTVAPLRFGMWDENGWHHDGLYQGDVQLDLDQFLIAAGRGDVIARMNRRYWLRVGLVVVGGVMALGGTGYTATARSCAGLVNQLGPGDDLADCQDEVGTRQTIGTLGIIVGLGMVATGLYASNRRPGGAELRAIARQFNAAHATPRRTVVTSVSILPALSPTSAGVTVGLTF